MGKFLEKQKKDSTNIIVESKFDKQASKIQIIENTVSRKTKNLEMKYRQRHDNQSKLIEVWFNDAQKQVESTKNLIRKQINTQKSRLEVTQKYSAA